MTADILNSNTTKNWLLIKRIVRFGETDSAGVIHFNHLLRWCHEAWEESLELYGIKAFNIFPGYNNNDVSTPEIALPIVHCQADYLKPIQLGDRLLLKLQPEKIDIASFQLKINFEKKNIKVASGLIRHTAIDIHTRRRCSLPKEIDLWIESSSINVGVQPTI